MDADFCITVAIIGSDDYDKYLFMSTILNRNKPYSSAQIWYDKKDCKIDSKRSGEPRIPTNLPAGMSYKLTYYMNEGTPDVRLRTGRQFMELIPDYTADIIICLVDWPDEDGLISGVLKAMREIKTPNTKVIFVLAVDDVDDPETAQNFEEMKNKISRKRLMLGTFNLVYSVVCSIQDIINLNRHKQYGTFKGLPSEVLRRIAINTFGRRKARVDYSSDAAVEGMIAKLDAEYTPELVEDELKRSGWYNFIELLEIESPESAVTKKFNRRMQTIYESDHPDYKMIADGLVGMQKQFRRIFGTEFKCCRTLGELVREDAEFIRKSVNPATGTIDDDLCGMQMIRLFNKFGRTDEEKDIKNYVRDSSINNVWFGEIRLEHWLSLHKSINSTFGIDLDIESACPNYLDFIYDSKSAYIIYQDLSNPAWMFYDILIKLGKFETAKNLIEEELLVRRSKILHLDLKDQLKFSVNSEIRESLTRHNIIPAINRYWVFGANLGANLGADVDFLFLERMYSNVVNLLKSETGR